MALTTTSSLDLSKAAYEMLAYYALRPELYYDALVEVQSTNATNRGVSVQFTIASDLAEATTALNESSDTTPVAMSDSYVVVTPLEYGNAVQLTSKLGATAFMEVNPIAANIVGWNAGISTDGIARNAAGAGTQVAYAGSATSRATVAKTSTIAGNDVRRAVATLRKQNVATFNGMYKGLIHPDASYDFRGATGGTNWSDPHVYSDPSGIYNGVIGNFQGVQFMETPRAPFFSDGGLNHSQSAQLLLLQMWQQLQPLLLMGFQLVTLSPSQVLQQHQVQVQLHNLALTLSSQLQQFHQQQLLQFLFLVYQM